MLSNGNNGQPYRDRLKVADVLLHYGKDLSQSRLGLIRSPFRDERTPSFHILANGYAWKAVMEDNPSDHQDGSEYPVESVDLIDFLEFVCKLDSLSGIAFTIQSYPEWLYATHLGGVADCDSSLTDKAWFEENSDGATHPVKQKQSDDLGLYDILGNVAEWTISGSDPLFFTVGGSYESDKVHCSAGMMDMAHGDVALGSLGFMGGECVIPMHSAIIL